ncbi:hypothetical protein BUALT_Bualt11G0082100 [Buddleja alternifolia]|uniref:Uncharacterized protein n=1 Tax=Buddleja alternifolia TaxID=168488 RepID=A0AAV6WSJ4_9LAMI|nr:hypothetical protein BUALT_Bualt11G0082100 [Buddleja alternifolia]
MEATKERKEQKDGELKQQQKKDDYKDDPMCKAREVIREAIISKTTDDQDDKNSANKAEDVLAYSRAVHHTDSYLE